eukprot:9155277-Alexandrium_andersonii.AAC.1
MYLTEGLPSAETGGAPEGAAMWYETGSSHRERGAAAQQITSSDRTIGSDGLAGNPHQCLYLGSQSDVLA